MSSPSLPTPPDALAPLSRPWTLWLFSLLIAAIGVMNLALAVDHVQRADDLRALGVSYPPLLRATFALLWGCALLWAAYALARRTRHARRWTLVIVSNYGAFGVLWLVIFARSDYGRERIAFQAAVTVALVCLAWLILRWRRLRVALEPENAAGTSSSPVTPSEAHSGDVPL